MGQALAVIVFGTIGLGLIMAVVLKHSRMINTTSKDWDVDQDELRPLTAADAKRYGYTGERCPNCHSYRMLGDTPEHRLWDIRCLDCSHTYPARI